MYQHYKQYLWLVGCLVLSVGLLTGAVIGGLAGYVIAGELAPPAQSAPRQSMANPEASSALNLEQVAVTTPLAAVEAPAPAVAGETTSVEAVNKVLPAVVTVLNQGRQGGGSGSGFFISAEGYVVTNNHVVEGAQELAVIYAQGGTAPAVLVGTAPDFDLAVLKVAGPVPAVAAWGDSGELPLGAPLIAIGSALGQYQNTVTAGVLSGFNRELGGFRGLLQTDAAINHGNSGGPLINLAGQVIGINAMVLRGGFSEAEGMGFAIPSNVAQTVVRRLVETGDARPSFLGIQYQELNPQVVSEAQLTVNHGALLQEVLPGQSAAQAGLQVGDIIVAVNGQAVDDRHPLVSLLLEHVAGETVTIEILRDGEIIETDLTLGERA